MDNSPEDFIHAMQTALERSDYETAQQHSTQAIEHYPDHKDFHESVERINECHDCLYDDKACVAGLKAFYKQVVQESLLSKQFLLSRLHSSS